jgi:single-stranded DNA-binding protein
MYIKGTPDYSRDGEKRETGLFAGLISNDGEMRQTKNGKNYATASVRAFNRQDGSAVFMTLKSFNESTAAVLSNLCKGDRVLAAGTVETDEYNGKSYTTMMVDFLLTADEIPSMPTANADPFAALNNRVNAAFGSPVEQDMGELPFK